MRQNHHEMKRISHFQEHRNLLFLNLQKLVSHSYEMKITKTRIIVIRQCNFNLSCNIWRRGYLMSIHHHTYRSWIRRRTGLRKRICVVERISPSKDLENHYSYRALTHNSETDGIIDSWWCIISHDFDKGSLLSVRSWLIFAVGFVDIDGVEKQLWIIWILFFSIKEMRFKLGVYGLPPFEK